MSQQTNDKWQNILLNCQDEIHMDTSDTQESSMSFLNPSQQMPFEETIVEVNLPFIIFLYFSIFIMVKWMAHKYTITSKTHPSSAARLGIIFWSFENLTYVLNMLLLLICGENLTIYFLQNDDRHREPEHDASAVFNPTLSPKQSQAHRWIEFMPPPLSGHQLGFLFVTG